MLPASNKGVGMNIGFPDPCLTPAGPVLVPVPYPNMAMNAVAAPFSPNLFLTMMPALNMGSMIPMTMGDEAGAANVIFKMAGGYNVGNPKVVANGLPAINLTCPTHGNTFNNPAGAALVPSVTNVLFTLEGLSAPSPRHEELSDLADRMNGRGAGAPRARLFARRVGYLALPVFTRDAPARAHSLLRELERRGMRSLVIDLRGCPGGDLEAALDLADEFLPDGVELATVVDADGDAAEIRATRGHVWALPVAVLVDRRTASAAEAFAACLQSHARAVIVGERTYGKGRIERVSGADADGALVTTEVAECRRPGGGRIHGEGIEPDLARRGRTAQRLERR